MLVLNEWERMRRGDSELGQFSGPLRSEQNCVRAGFAFEVEIVEIWQEKISHRV